MIYKKKKFFGRDHPPGRSFRTVGIIQPDQNRYRAILDDKRKGGD